MATRGKKKVETDPSYRDLKADYYPVQRVIPLGMTGVEVDYYTLDVGRNLSVTNHRLYRQGKTYSCKLDLDAGSATSAYDIYALVDTWYIQKAWQLARATYLKTTADERAQVGKQMVARWEDFRVASGLSGSTNQLVPYRYSNGLAGLADQDGEFFLSQITLPDGVTNRTFAWDATAGGIYGILDEYDKTNNTLTTTGETTADLAYAGVDADTHEVAADALKLRGRSPPYDATAFNTRVWVKIARLDAAAAHGKLSTGYFNAPCGLIAVHPTTSSQVINGQLTLTVQAGDYKGVKAHNMGA